MQTFKILWIDDEHESLASFKGEARRNGIQLEPFKSMNGGMDHLERNYRDYDGVLLDARMLEDEDNVAGSEDDEYVYRAKERLLQLPKKFELFVLTGAPELRGDGGFRKAFKNVYAKGSDDDISRLFKDLKESAQALEDTQIRHTYRRAFAVCTEKYIGDQAGQDLLGLLKVDDKTDFQKNLNCIRTIVEDLFSAFAKFELLPNEFVSRQIELSTSSKFLAGIKHYCGAPSKEPKYHHLEETHLPKPIAKLLKSILDVTQPGSHRTAIDEHIRMVNTHYLMKSVLYQLMDVLIWFKIYIDGKPKTQNWKRIDGHKTAPIPIGEWVRGVVIELNNVDGYAFFKPAQGENNEYIPPHLVEEYSLENDSIIEVQTELFNDNRSGEEKTRVKRIRKVI